MRKIALGIIAVFFVQVGFQFYTVVERTNSGYSQVTSVAPLPERPLAMADVETVDLRSAFESGDPRRATGSRRSIDRSWAYRVRPAAKELTSKKPLFPPVIITIPQPTRYETAAYRSERIEPAAAKRQTPLPPVREKRTLSSKALSAAKKPYDLLKFVASKLL